MSNRSITLGLVIVSLSLVSLIIGVGGMGLHAMKESNFEAKNIAAQQWRDVQLTSELLDHSNRNNQINVQILSSNDPAEVHSLLAERAENNGKITALFAILQTHVASLQEQESLDAVLAARKPYVASYESATKLLLTGKKAEAQAILIHDTMPLLLTYRSALREYANFQVQEMSRQLDGSNSRYRTAHREVAVLMILSVLLALGIAAFVIRKIVIEIRRREKAERGLRELNSELEAKIRERTASLEESNRNLSFEIAERKRKEALVNRLSTAVEQSPASVIITDLSGRIIYVNRSFQECTGYSYDEAIGQNPRILKSGYTKPEEYERLWRTIRAGKEWRGEFCNRKKNGDLYWEYALICPIREEDSKISHYLAIKEDITERRRAEKDLRLKNFALENASDSVLWVDRQANILYANGAACRVLGRSRQELTSLAISDIDPTFPREGWEGFWQELKTHRSLTFETQPRNKEGQPLAIEVMATYLEFDKQEYLLSFARDISERRMIQAQLQQAQKMESIGQLAAGIAHEINTPTQFVSDNLTFLRDSCPSVKEVVELYRRAILDNSGTLPQDLVNTIRQAERTCDLEFVMAEVPCAIEQALDGAHRVAKIVRAMKEFSHPGSEEKQPADINQAILTTLTVSRNEWKYVAEVETVLQPDLQMVPCHIGELNQVLLNLLINSAHAIAELVADGSDKKGKITIRTAQDAQFTTITVRDTGGGIRPEIQSRVFDPFFTTKAVGRGSGQGLFLAHNSIVKKHGGKIWFESEVGKGTTFFIQLPTAGGVGTHVETHSVR
jgi:two-component system, NtrC family, sensor kinase